MISFGAEKLGYVHPPEWFPQVGTWLSWPHNLETWEEQELVEAQKEYAAFVAVITQSQEAKILVASIEMMDIANRFLDETNVVSDRVKFYLKKTNDAWMRDHGPDFLIHPEKGDKVILNWEYNAWGEKYPPFDDDNEVPLFIADNLGLKAYTTDYVLEGGSYELNEYGDLITTRSCLLNPNRNPFYDEELVEGVLQKYIGCQSIVWLEDGIVGDDTDGHIDDFCRLLPNKKVLLAATEDEKNPNYEVLKNAYSTLEELKEFELIKLPIPSPIKYKNGDFLPASYANYCITNTHVIVPVFGDEKDKEAIRVIQQCFPEREVVGLPSNNLIIGLGSFHCLSKQEPKV